MFIWWTESTVRLPDRRGKKIRENQRVTNEEIARFIKCFKKKQ